MSSKRIEEPLQRIGTKAVQLAYDFGHEYATVEHLLAATVVEKEIEEMFERMNVDIPSIKKQLNEFFKSGSLPIAPRGASPQYTNMFNQLVFRAAAQGQLSAKGSGDAIDLILVMVRAKIDDNYALLLLRRAGVTEAAIKQFINSKKPSTVENGKPGTVENTNTPAGDITDRASAEVFITQYAYNLNKRAAESKTDPLIGRVQEVADAVQIFSRKKKNNPLLVGEPGVGKTAIVEGMAHMIINKQVPKVMDGTVIYALDIGALLAGTKYRGDFEERMTKVIKAMSLIPKSVLFVDEIHMIMGAGSGAQGSMDAANMLKPALSDGTLRMIGSTTFEEFRKHFEKDRALLRRFGKITVEEPSLEDARKIIHGVAESYANHHKVVYTSAALDAAVDLTHKYVTTGLLPDKAIDIIDMAGARLAVNDNRASNILDVAEIEAEVSRVAKIPEHTIKDDETTKLGNLETDLQTAVFGQDGAIQTLSDAVFIARAGLREQDKTQGAYLFTGPTGTGKTEVAKQLAATLGIPLLRFDMSDYMEKHSVSRLIGAPPGYVGYDEGGGGSGALTNAVEQSPHCVLLLDEIEKAHPDIFNIMLQVMDNGMLTNSGGKVVSFRNVWLIMTSNAGVREGAKASIGFGASASSSQSNADAAINKIFSPEFRNRLDARMSFNALTTENVARVAEKFIEDLRMMVADRKVKLVITDDAMTWLAQKGYDPVMGARPMKRVIADHIKKPLARMLVMGDLKDGGKVTVGIKDNAITLKKTKR